MRLHFDDAFDGGAWPGPHGAKATAGELWLGRSGLLGTLETHTGLAHAGSGARLGEVLRALQGAPGFWSASFDADALATAQELIRIHDTLRLHGWTNQVQAPRLQALADAFARGVSPCTADRLEQLLPAVQHTRDLRGELQLHSSLDSLPLRLREVLAAFASRVEVAPPLPALDFAALAPRLELVRPYGPLAAAEVVAQALAASPEVPTVIIGGDSVLDLALRRHGLPTTGAAAEAHDNALGEVLPLVIELGLQPADPSCALQLLTLPVGPIRKDVARKLVKALHQWPAVGSIEWEDALTRATADFTNEEKEQLRARLADFLQATVDPARPYPAAELTRRAGLVQRWLQGKLAHAEEASLTARHLKAASAQVSAFTELVATSGTSALSLAQVRRFLEQAREAMPAPAAWAPQANLLAFDQPGCVVGKAERVVWWDFTRGAFSVPRRLPLMPEELAALRAAGVALPSPAEEAMRLMVAARRPLHHATGALWLVCPRHEGSGDEAAPHPLWDEAIGALGSSAAQARVRAEPMLAKPPRPVQREALPLPKAITDWKTSVPLERRDKESPSSVESLLGCSFRWALDYVGKLRAGTTARLDTSQRMLGTLAHHVLLKRVLRASHASPQAAGDFAVKVLHDEGPSLAAPLFQPGQDAERSAVTEATRRAAEALWLRVADGWPVRMTEEEIEGKAFRTTFAGGVDLVLGDERNAVIVDLKWSGAGYRRGTLEEGSAIQLAAYAELLRQSGFKDPAVAYFIIQSQTWLSTDTRGAPGELQVADPQVDTWALTTKAHAAAWKEVKAGRLTAPGTVKEASETTEVVEDELQVGPPCRFCDFDGLCGRRYGTVEVADEEG